MLVFIDESGDPGFGKGGNCSAFFVVTLVIFHDYAEAQRTEEAIKQLRRDLHVPENYEFHFSKMKDDWRIQFLKTVSRFKWVYVAMALNKAALYGQGFKVPDSLYKYTVRRAFEAAKGHIRDAKVVIDSSGNRNFREELKAYLRQRVNKVDEDGLNVIRKLALEDSHRNDLLQLADMACGAFARNLTRPEERNRFQRFIAANQMIAQRWP